jgi:hypothetical protein
MQAQGEADRRWEDLVGRMLMAEEIAIDDPHFNPEVLNGKSIYTTNKICGDRSYRPALWIRTGRSGKHIDPFTRKDVKIVMYSYLLNKEEKGGAVRVNLYEFLEVSWRSHVCRIPLGNRELTMNKTDYESEYKYTGFDLGDAVRVIYRACLEGLIPSDFLNEGVKEWLELVDSKR